VIPDSDGPPEEQRDSGNDYIMDDDFRNYDKDYTGGDQMISKAVQTKMSRLSFDEQERMGIEEVIGTGIREG
jgi:hypothetical protein